MSIFDLPQSLESLTGGATRFDCTELYPISGNIAQQPGSYIGSGQASGNTIFQFGSGSSVWWSPAMSYFRMQLALTKMSAANVEGLPPIVSGATNADYVALADNFVSTLFTKITTQINSKVLDTIDNVAVMDTALHYANCRDNFLKTFGSLSWLGVPFMTRLAMSTNNTSQTSYVPIEVIFRPAISIFDCKILPPGAQFTFTFNWAPSATNAFESMFGDVAVGTAINNYNLRVTGFSMFQSAVTPSNMVQLPQQAVIDLCPSVVNQYYLNGGANLKQNITIPSTTNRILVTAQDASTTTYEPGFYTAGSAAPAITVTAGIGKSFNSATSFSLVANSQSGSQKYPDRMISTMWLSLPELGVNEPNPVYNFQQSQLDISRAYSDFCHITQGTINGVEGSIPFGSLNVTQGVHMIGAVFNAGDRNNCQAPTIIAVASDATTPRVFNAGGGTYGIKFQNYTPATAPPTCYQAAKWGWAGSRPGPIFAFPCIRPEGKTVSVGTLNVTYQAYSELGSSANAGSSVASVVFNVISSYSMALQLQHTGNGVYNYTVVEGV
jgi:hypothetical protein